MINELGSTEDSQKRGASGTLFQIQHKLTDGGKNSLPFKRHILFQDDQE